MAFSMQIIFCCLILSSLVMMTTFAKPQIDIAESRLTVEELATSNHIQELQVQIDGKYKLIFYTFVWHFLFSCAKYLGAYSNKWITIVHFSNLVAIKKL